MRLVIFDFDGTIHLHETPRIFLKVLDRDDQMRNKLIRFYASVALLYVLYRFGLYRELVIKRILSGIARMLRGMSAVQLDTFFMKCFEEAKDNFSLVSLNRLKAHLEYGDQVLLLSGAFSPFLAIVAKELNIPCWLGTNLELSAGVCTGRIISPKIGNSKVQALDSFLTDQKNLGLVFDMDKSYAYADAIQDIPILSLVGHPVVVNPDSELIKEAGRRGWEIIHDEN